ncbi:VWA domain-containing protein [Roseibium album]|uniref:VWA domain-containing protein n=1 Tax=Roseibium album TaxID=311410 RepID=UPI00249392CD|nr:VWA domain-containing protein [Roseibium album]
MRRFMANAAVAALVAFGGITGITASSDKAEATIINLGFAIDSSGSVGSSGWNTQITGLAAALDSIPTSGANQYRVGVVAFNSGARTLVSPTIVTAGNIAGIKTAITTAAFSSGGTFIGAGINRLVSDFNGAGYLASETSLMNVTTDGISLPTSDAAARDAALLAGWEGISAECILVCANENSVGSQRLLNTVVSPVPALFVTNTNALPNPLTQSFVLKINTFDDYEAAIKAKVGKIVTDTGGGPTVVPLPAGLPLLLGGLSVLYAVRRKTA